MPELDLSLALPLFMPLLAAIIAAALSFAAYRSPVPPVSTPWRVILGVLRWSALMLVFLLIGEPLLSVVHRTHQPPGVAVLVDNSRSMTLTDGAGSRADAERRVLASTELRAVAGGASASWLLFDNRVRDIGTWSADSLTLTGDRTDIAGAFRALRERSSADNVRAVILVTDGNATTPENPVYDAEALAVPVFTVGVGDTAEQRDLAVRSVTTNAVAYAGTRVPVNVIVHSSGYGGERVEVTLDHRGRPADRATISVDAGTREYRVTLFMAPDSAGVHRSTVSVSRLEGEVTHKNNTSVVFTRVLSGKLKILLVAGSPGQDLAFLRHSLEADPNFDVTTRVQMPDGFREGHLTPELFTSSDCVILTGFPTAMTKDADLQMLLREDVQRKPFFVLLGRTVDHERLRRLNPLLPFIVESVLPNELQVFMSVPETRRMHPVVRFRSAGEMDDWSSLPPVFRLQGNFRSKPESDVLGVVRLQTATLNEPLLVVRRIAGRKSAAFLGYGIWRWKMLAPLDGTAAQRADEFLGNAIRWLTSIEDERRIRVRPVRESFSAFEPVEFSGQVYDDSMEPLSEADITVVIEGPDGRTTTGLVPLGSGQYAGSAEILPPGEYTFAASVNMGTQRLGEDRGSFSVGGLNAEFLETRMNRSLLEHLAFRTGGAYYDGRDLSGLAARIRSVPDFVPRERVERTETELWNSAWTLGLAVCLLACEWFFRKRLGML